MQNMTVHIKKRNGWEHQLTAPINWMGWNSIEQEWRRWMLEHGSQLVTVGDTMYQITEGKK